MKPETDNQIVNRCLRGETNAFAILIERYQNVVFNTAYRSVRTIEDAEDLAQAVFIKAFEHLHSFNTRYKFFSWLYRIAINETINYSKTHRAFESIDERLADESPDPQLDFEHLEERELVRQSLLRLSPEYRAVIELRHYQELPYGDIAQILGIPEKTVKSRLFTARQKLKDLLLHEYPEEIHRIDSTRG